jgi:hypothetical protein
MNVKHQLLAPVEDVGFLNENTNTITKKKKHRSSVKL